jgi:hypothetical protein
MIKLLMISITKHTPQNRVSDNITHVTLNIINSVLYPQNYNDIVL